MKKYITKYVTGEYLQFNSDNTFVVKQPAKNKFKIYIVDEQGNEIFNCLSKYMGTKSDELYEDFLLNMNGVYCKLFMEDELYLNNILEIMFIFLDVNNDGDILSGAYSYASHVYGFFTFFRRNVDIQEKYESIYQKMKRVISQIEDDYKKAKRENCQLYREINYAVGCLKKDVEMYISCGEIYFTNYESEDENMKGLLKKSEFHKNNRKKFDFTDIIFQKRRFLTICEYYFLKNTGLSYEKRCLMCYLIVRYLEDYKGFSY